MADGVDLEASTGTSNEWTEGKEGLAISYYVVDLNTPSYLLLSVDFDLPPTLVEKYFVGSGYYRYDM